jgi:azurin
MKKVTIHFVHPVLKYHACGMGENWKIEKTLDMTQVTCKRCLSTATGQKALAKSVCENR